MKTLKIALFATLFAVSANAASAQACNIAAADVTGDGNFVDLTVTGCGYTSLDMRGSYSFAEIINRFGAMVQGIYGGGNYYKVVNVGDNKVATYINGYRHETTLNIRGDGHEVVVNQNGRASSVDLNLRGKGTRVKITTN
ncbi:hypothetical protein [Pseudogemmobacter bohemicus]|uniref:hypothetical protein n=1 Tax=Pseudogemmobacter bohemicus TaxID=2250708 RepID=UPI000DD34B1F|nr:hypothetical protein [Pseudogemmobacter bohemicus]